jgi:phosphate transport system substrate-binding protein
MVMNGLNIADVPELQIGTTMISPYYQIEGDPTGISFTPFYYYSVIIGMEKTKGAWLSMCDPMTKENISKR